MRTAPKILLVGRSGQLGWELERALAPLGELIAAGRDIIDMADPESVARAVGDAAPEVIVNATAYSAVDRAETESALAHRVNGEAVGAMGRVAERLGALVIHYSTDYVFDGEKAGAYVETDGTGPLGEYGRSKLAGERALAASGAAHFVFRTSWVYAASGSNFMLTMLRLARQRPVLRVVADQKGAPTWARDLASATAAVLARRAAGERAASGVYHMSGSGETTWHGFAQRILALAGLATPVEAIPTSQYPTPAQRPKNSLLDNGKLRETFALQLPPWEVSLERCLGDMSALAPPPGRPS
jgi:dTDP-4-dehydrorhamnose reductase